MVKHLISVAALSLPVDRRVEGRREQKEGLVTNSQAPWTWVQLLATSPLPAVSSSGRGKGLALEVRQEGALQGGVGNAW